MVRNTPILRDHVRSKVSPFFQTGFICGSFLVLAMIFLLRMDHYRAIDERKSPETVSPERLRQFGGSPEIVTVGLNIERFHHFDIVKNEFEFTGSLWFECEAGSVSVDTLQDFTFSRGMILQQSPPETKLIGSRLLLRYVIRAKFSSGLVFSDFPFDDHRISLELTHPFLSPEEVIFDASVANFTNQTPLTSFGWQEKSLSVKTGFLSSDLSKANSAHVINQPIAMFTIDVERYGYRQSFSILLPILLIFYLMFFSLSVDPGTSFTIALGGITGILAYRFVIEQLSPASSDLMVSDHLFFLILSCSFLIFLINNVDILFFPLGTRAKRYAIITVHLLTIAAVTWIVVP